MAKKLVCLQAGHQNARQNCWEALRGGTGAPGEAEFTVAMRDKVSEILQTKGIAVQLVDATFNCKDDVGKDFDLFLAIHYDADIYRINGQSVGGGFIDTPHPANDAAHEQSTKIANAMKSEYFKGTGIVEHSERSNANTRYYYMWNVLSAKTPCVIIECGVGKNAGDASILSNKDRVATAIAKGICKGLGVQWEEVPTPPEDVDYKKVVSEIRGYVFKTGSVYTRMTEIGKIYKRYKI